MRIHEIITEAHINQQLSKYHPETQTYRGSHNVIPNSNSINRDDITAKLKQVDQYSDDEVYDKDTYGSIDDIEKNIDRGSLKKLIAAAIDTLTPQEKQVLTLRYWKDLDPRDVAMHMKRSVEGVRQIELKALRKLKHPKHADTLRAALGLEDVTFNNSVYGWYNRGVQDGFRNVHPRKDFDKYSQRHYDAGYLSGSKERDKKLTGTPNYSF